MKFLLRIFTVLLTLLITGAMLTTAATAGERLKKLDAQGRELPDEAATWAMVLDSASGLYWEVKSLGESIHANTATYNFTDAKTKFIAQLNAEQFGGFSDWRLPTTEELAALKLRKPGDEAQIDLNFYPNTIPGRYMSLGWCGSKSEYQEENVKFGNQNTPEGKFVRAVRGKPLD